MSDIRVRFAPSPTGYLHVGGARTALFNYLFAKSQGGEFVLRVEDTDLERSTEEALKMQIGDLQWLGLDWDEGPNAGTLADEGEYGPYRQSRRQAIYQAIGHFLLKNGKAYFDFRTDEELDTLKKQSADGHSIPRPETLVSYEEGLERVKKGEQGAVRLINSFEKTFKVNDLVRGDVEFKSDMVGDFVILRSNGMPVYNFCCAIDDALMSISHVLRAEEHLSNTLRQLMIYELLEELHKSSDQQKEVLGFFQSSDFMGFVKDKLEKVHTGAKPSEEDFKKSEESLKKFFASDFVLPQFGHMSLILGPDKQKLSKRHGATSCNEYHTTGFLPDALINYISLLGWSHPDEKDIFKFEELVKIFSISRVNKSPAVFDEEKLSWVNSQHIKELDNQSLWQEVLPWLEGVIDTDSVNEAWVNAAMETYKTRMDKLSDAKELFAPMNDQSFAIDGAAQDALSWDSTKDVFATWIAELKTRDKEYLTADDFSEMQDAVKEKAGVKGKFLFMPIRVAIIGKPHGAELKELVPLIPTKSLIQRAETALAAL